MESSTTLDAVRYVQEVELAPVHSEAAARAATAALADAPAVSPDEPEADVDAGSLVSFVAGVSLQHRSDCLNSTLFAQFVANAAADRFDPNQVIAWYRAYLEALQNVGWSAQAWQFQNYQASGSTFTINAAILGLVASFLPANQLSVVKAALEALQNLGTDKPWYVVWDSQSRDANGGNFQIAAAADSNGEKNTLVLRTSGYSFSTTETTTRFLWNEYHTSDTNLHYALQDMSLAEDVYAKVRDLIIQRLGKYAVDYVLSVPMKP